MQSILFEVSPTNAMERFFCLVHPACCDEEQETFTNGMVASFDDKSFSKHEVKVIKIKTTNVFFMKHKESNPFSIKKF